MDYRNAAAQIRPTISAAIELILTCAAPLVGAVVPVEPAAEDVVPDGELPEELALEVARVLPVAEPLAFVSEGRVTAEPEPVEPPAGRVVPVAGALTTVGTEAAGVTWIWPSENWETGASVEVAAGVVVMLAHGVVPTWTWPVGVCFCKHMVSTTTWTVRSGEGEEEGNLGGGGLERLTIGDLGDLAQGDTGGGGPNLGLAVAQGADDGGSDDLSADDLAVTGLAGVTAAGHHDDLDGRALRRPGAVVQVVKVARVALVPDGRAAQRQRAIAAGREARGEDGTGLGRRVELELEVAGDVTRPLLRVGQGARGQGGDQDAIAGAGAALLWAC